MRYHNITKDDMLNGDGLRVVLWVAGCNHCCKECQNPITWDPYGGVLFDGASHTVPCGGEKHQWTHHQVVKGAKSPLASLASYMCLMFFGQKYYITWNIT